MTVLAENLGPLRDATLAQARADAEATLADADRRADARIAAAREEGSALVRQARADGAAAAAIEGAHDEATARRTARALVLAAERRLYDELCRRAGEEAYALRGENGYAALLEELGDAARRQLGDGARLDVDPVGLGGVRAWSNGRSVDYTLPTLVDRALERLGARTEVLWQ
ncbi:MAG TPA: hypothetical protein VMT74_14270 [Gaiellaceae bacterium]|nr:hypothetical protein [Gaiellaceae bacterium]